MSLREEIAEEFNNCMGFHEGINVPDCHMGERAIDYADKVLKLVKKRIDEKIAYYNGLGEFRKNSVRIDELEQLKQEILK